MSDASATISARGLAVTLGAREVLRGVALDVRPGALMALLGPNGAGKSTLLRALGCLLPYRGRVSYGSVDGALLSAHARARCVAYVPQHTELRAPLRVRDVVALGRFAHGGGPGRLSRLDADAVAAAMADADVEAFADRRFDRLSGGEQRRVLIARALATRARTLLLDEPTAGLDVRHVLATHRLLRSLAERGTAVTVVLHDLDDARAIADRAVLLDAGRIVAEGTPGEVVAHAPVAAVYRVRLRERSGLRYAQLGEGESC